MLTVLWSSFAVVAVGEMGDKTQLIALSLAARYRRPWTVMLGILVATLANHGLASAAGAWAARAISAWALGWAVGLGFIAFGVWTLFPDSAGEPGSGGGWGPLLSTIVIFFLAEMGDKTQLATLALGARFDSTLTVTAGTTLGMLAADALAVFAGGWLVERVPMRRIRWIAASIFALFGVAAIAHTLL